MLSLRPTRQTLSHAENWVLPKSASPPRSVCLTSFGPFLLMSNKPALRFPVAKFAIEENVKGAEHDLRIYSALPHLPTLQISSLSAPHFPRNPFSLLYQPPATDSLPHCSSSQFVHQFPHNPFSLPNEPVTDSSPDCSSSTSVSRFPRNSFSLSHESATDSLPNCSNTFHADTYTALPISCSSSTVLSPFPNPFLIKPSLSGPAPLTQPTSEPSRTTQPISAANGVLMPACIPRKPLADRVLVHNALRPRVLAADRLFSWRTPYGISHDESLLAELPAELVESAKMSIMGALAPSTRSTYASGILRFNQFCDKWEISEAARMPASYILLCAFIGQHKGSMSGKTIRSWMSGIRAWHLANHAPWFGDDNWVQMARASANKEGSHHRRALRAPVSIEHLMALRKAIDLSFPFHAAVWAVALTTFFGCRRLGETTVSSLSSFDARFHVLRSAGYALSFASLFLFTDYFHSVSFKTLRDGSSSVSFRIPWTKTTREEGASVIVTARNDTLCPCSAIRHHLDINKDLPGSASLFAYATTTGQWEHMTKNRFLVFCTSIWSKAALAHVLGHSFRIGGAVELLLAGVPPEIVAATGGWTSLAFLLYWRRMEEILPMSTSRAYQRSHVEALAKIFEQFRIHHHIPASLLPSSDTVIDL